MYYNRERRQDVFEAFVRQEAAVSGNWHSDGERLCLHGNRIASWEPDGGLFVTDAGWQTVTTATGLRAVLWLVTRWSLSRWELKHNKTGQRLPWVGKFTIRPYDILY